jgi:uncharacterized membrane protein required for colicin V production
MAGGEDVTWNWLSVAVLAYIVLGAISGWRRGVILVAFSLAGYLVGLVVAARYQPAITNAVLRALPIDRWLASAFASPAIRSPGTIPAAEGLAHLLVAVLVFLLVVGIVEMVARAIGEGLTRVVHVVPLVGGLNRLAGLAGGLVENAAVAGLILGLVLSLPPVAHSPLAPVIRHTPLAYDLARAMGRLANWPAQNWLNLSAGL